LKIKNHHFWSRKKVSKEYGIRIQETNNKQQYLINIKFIVRNDNFNRERVENGKKTGGGGTTDRFRISNCSPSPIPAVSVPESCPFSSLTCIILIIAF
jgi:hypothetical protein